MKIFLFHRVSTTKNLVANFAKIFWAQFSKRANNHRRLVIFALIISLCTTVNPASAFSASPANNNSLSFTSTSIGKKIHKQTSYHEDINLEQSEIKEQVIKFYLDPALVPDMAFAKTVLPKYVVDMNIILAKNTNRRLVFNPETDIILTDTQPQTNSASMPLPVEGFEIWAHAVLSTYPYSYDGYGGLDASGAGVLAGLKWRKIYNPDVVTGGELKDYWIQINNMLHELAHVYKAGIGEYYKLATIQDATGVPPYQNINVLDPYDSFWSDKPDFMPDPLLRNAIQEGLTSREALLDYVKYSALTAIIMSGNYRNGTPTVDLQNITMNIVSVSGEPIIDANVKIWSVIGNAPYQAELLVDTVTDSNGQISFAWGSSSNPHNNYDFLRLIKVYKDGFTVSVMYVSIFDADIEKLVNGNDMYNISILLNAATPLTISSIICASPNPTIATSVDFNIIFSASVTGVDESDFTVTKTGSADATVSSVSGAEATYTVSVSSGSSGIISLNLVDNDTIMDGDSNALGGVGEENLVFSGGETCTISNAYRVFLPLTQH